MPLVPRRHGRIVHVIQLRTSRSRSATARQAPKRRMLPAGSRHGSNELLSICSDSIAMIDSLWCSALLSRQTHGCQSTRFHDSSTGSGITKCKLRGRSAMLIMLYTSRSSPAAIAAALRVSSCADGSPTRSATQLRTQVRVSRKLTASSAACSAPLNARSWVPLAHSSVLSAGYLLHQGAARCALTCCVGHCQGEHPRSYTSQHHAAAGKQQRT